jgi:16S rRNA (guanine527-N7)-methyltransferase
LLGWNERVNLTAITDPLAVEQMLFLDALRMVPALSEAITHRKGMSLRLIDIGTGAGFPGLPLAIVFPELSFTLLDATNKKIAFLGEVVRELALTNVTPTHGRAEELGHEAAFRATFNLATARAVSSLPALIELTIPLLTVGGRAFFPKSTDIEVELNQGQRAANVLGGRIASAQIVPAGTDEKVTRLVIVDKIGATPNRFPRRAGLPAREPLGRDSGL